MIYNILYFSSLCISYQNYDKSIVVDLNQHRFIACKNGKIVNNGKAIGGRKKCQEKELKNHICKTPNGRFSLIKKYGKNKRSDRYPLECKNKKKCGAKMPWYFKIHHSGIGIHGNYDIEKTKENESHGCIRVSITNARWLNKNFVDYDTKIIILPY